MGYTIEEECNMRWDVIWKAEFSAKEGRCDIERGSIYVEKERNKLGRDGHRVRLLIWREMQVV